MLSNHRDTIKELEIFKGCSGDLSDRFMELKTHRIRKKEKGAYIGFAGDKLSHVMILLEGTAFTTKVSPEGKEIVIIEKFEKGRTLVPGLIYHQEAVLHVNIIARTSCTVLYVDRNTFSEILRWDSTIMMNFIESVSHCVVLLSKRINGLALQTLKQRVLEYLNNNRVITDVTWLARVFSVAQPSLSRVLSELKREGLVERTIDGIQLTTTKQK